MRKIFCLSVLFAFIPLLSICKPVDLSTARQIANNFWTVVNHSTQSEKWTDISSQTGFQEFYIFTRDSEEGFVIVAADDCVQPILGYSTNSRFITPLPDHVYSFLNRYEQEISFYKENNISATNEISMLWESLLAGTYTPKSTTSVTPLLQTTWNQAPLYNNLCPGDGNDHAVTGCVATATAQVMKYWGWPHTGEGSHSYTDGNFGYQSADFSATTYDWDQMPNALTESSTPTQVAAVATLMYHIGVAVEMNYDYDGSGAVLSDYNPSAEYALKNYFQYDFTMHSVSYDNVTDNEWISILKNELDADPPRPILERGQSASGGHAFVCDGYNEDDLFHINWGWGGYCDGYFAHNGLNPNGSGIGGNQEHAYNIDVGILIGIMPRGAYQVTTYSADNTMGSTTGDGFFNSGSTIDIMATAEPGYRFRQWNDGNTENPRSVLVFCDTVFTAYFDEISGNEIYYDNGTYSSRIGAAGSLWWGVRFPGSTFSDYNTLDAVKVLYADPGTYMLYIYQGGDNAPETLMYIDTFQLSGNDNYLNWFTVQLSSAIHLDPTKCLWITFYSTAANPAAVSTYTGNSDGSWFSINGNTWTTLSNDYDIYWTWMVHAILSNSEWHTINVVSENPSMGTTTGSGEYIHGNEIQIEALPEDGYEFVRWSTDGIDETDDSVNVLNPRTIRVTCDATYTASFQPTVVGIQDLSISNVKIYSDGRNIIVDGAEGTSVEIYDMTGRLIVSDEHNNLNHRTFTVKSSGIYVVHTGNGITKKVMVVR